jgi:hypothetical protein
MGFCSVSINSTPLLEGATEALPSKESQHLNWRNQLRSKRHGERNCYLSTDGLCFAVYSVNPDKLGGMKAKCGFVPGELSSLNRQPSVEPLAACFFNDSAMLAGTNWYKFASQAKLVFLTGRTLVVYGLLGVKNELEFS